MAVRIRKSGLIVCAAKSEPEPGDYYIDDGLHYRLGVELRVMTVYGQDKNGADLWEFHCPRIGWDNSWEKIQIINNEERNGR